MSPGKGVIFRNPKTSALYTKQDVAWVALDPKSLESLGQKAHTLRLAKEEAFPLSE